MKNVRWAGLCLCAFGCMGGGDGGASRATFDGTVDGQGLVAADSAVVNLTDEGMPFATLVLLTDTGGACETLQGIVDWKDAVTEAKDPILPSATIFWLMFLQRDSAGNPVDVTTGSYDIASLFAAGSAAGGDHTRMASAVFEQTDATCAFQTHSTAVSGNATLDEVNLAPGGHVKGSYRATMEKPGEQVSGSFDASYCAELEFKRSGSLPSACAGPLLGGIPGSGGAGSGAIGMPCPAGATVGTVFQCACDANGTATGTQTCQGGGLLSDCLCEGRRAECMDGAKSMPGAADDPCPQIGTMCASVGGKAVACCAGSIWARNAMATVDCKCEQATTPITCSGGASL